jgi:flavin reductase (DIM6/NTAB) family NADH-FMN oxidoreductase RutF
LSREQIKVRSFDDLFKQINVKEIPEDVFTLMSEDFAVLTAGTPSHYNSMVVGWGGWGTSLNRPVAYCILRASRYTLELMRKEQTYTMTFFDEQFKDDIMEFGKQSGRDSDAKMKNTQLTSVQTPDGNMTFKEAKLIIELKLAQVTTVSPDDFYLQEGRDFVVNANPGGKHNDYHKIVFGEITNVWVSK